MLLKKKTLPEDNEIVLCTVSKVQFHSVFAVLNEYENRSGMIHISEISPGRIRNIRDFVKEDKVIVCKVLSVNREKGHIDLSLRRVTESQRRSKINDQKKEQKVEKILEVITQKHGKNATELYATLRNGVGEQYATVYDFFEACVMGEDNLQRLGLDKSLEKEIDDTIKQRIKPREVSISGVLSLISYEPEGVEHIKEALNNAKVSGPNVTLLYTGAGKYHVEVSAVDYKDAEEIIGKASETAISTMKLHKGEASFAREEKKG
jgi:translation initiation factor 2 subunit 1